MVRLTFFTGAPASRANTIMRCDAVNFGWQVVIVISGTAGLSALLSLPWPGAVGTGSSTSPWLGSMITRPGSDTDPPPPHAIDLRRVRRLLVDPVPTAPGEGTDNSADKPAVPLMTMTTCHPKFTASHRMIVFARLAGAPVKNVNLAMPQSVLSLYDEVGT